MIESESELCKEIQKKILLSGYAGIECGQIVDCREYPNAEKIEDEYIPNFLKGLDNNEQKTCI